ncbi:MAG TPA: methyltransferase domain-containing protein [Microbacterium sp.]|nr:methyltransferase domain-containing protein [Microbacterium sp.]
MTECGSAARPENIDTGDRAKGLAHPRFTLANRYDADWLRELDMGPNPLWMLEDLLMDVPLRPGMRVLDLGCGRGATSVFLAEQMDVEVWAVDLWIDADDNARRFTERGLDGRVHAVQADARALPFDDGAFDAILCIDAYEYFGTDVHALPALLRVLAPGARIGVATPSIRRELRELGGIPSHIRDVVGWEALAWPTVAAWRFLWEQTGLAHVVAREQEGAASDWLRWAEFTASGSVESDAVIRMLETDAGELLTFASVSGAKPA